MENLSCEIPRVTADRALAVAHEEGDCQGEEYAENDEEDHDLLVYDFPTRKVRA